MDYLTSFFLNKTFVNVFKVKEIIGLVKRKEVKPVNFSIFFETIITYNKFRLLFMACTTNLEIKIKFISNFILISFYSYLFSNIDIKHTQIYIHTF